MREPMPGPGPTEIPRTQLGGPSSPGEEASRADMMQVRVYSVPVAADSDVYKVYHHVIGPEDSVRIPRDAPETVIPAPDGGHWRKHGAFGVLKLVGLRPGVAEAVSPGGDITTDLIARAEAASMMRPDNEMTVVSPPKVLADASARPSSPQLVGAQRNPAYRGSIIDHIGNATLLGSPGFIEGSQAGPGITMIPPGGNPELYALSCIPPDKPRPGEELGPPQLVASVLGDEVLQLIADGKANVVGWMLVDAGGVTVTGSHTFLDPDVYPVLPFRVAADTARPARPVTIDPQDIMGVRQVLQTTRERGVEALSPPAAQSSLAAPQQPMPTAQQAPAGTERLSGSSFTASATPTTGGESGGTVFDASDGVTMPVVPPPSRWRRG
jgi:hypothetical protein